MSTPASWITSRRTPSSRPVPSVKRTVRHLHGAFGELRFEVEDEMDDLGPLVQLGLLPIGGEPEAG
jgi:hypothetical protein